MKKGVILVALALGACASFDEAAPKSTGTEPDAGTDGSSVDVPDAAASDAGTTGFCAQNPGTWCEDFDDPQRAPTYPREAVSFNGRVDVVDEPHVSSPRALRVRMDSADNAPSGCRTAMREVRDLAIPAPAGFTAEYKLRLAELGGKTDLGAGVQMVGDGGVGVCAYYLEVTPTELAFNALESGTGLEERYPLKRPPSFGAWTTISIDVHGAPGNRAISVAVDGSPAITGVKLPAYCQTQKALYGGAVGASCIHPTATGKLDLAIDDVRVIAH